MLIDRSAGWRLPIIGGASHGTVNHAEAACFLHGLRYDLYQMDGGKLCAGHGINPYLWVTYQSFRDQGYILTFHHQPRDQNPLHVSIDAASKPGRVVGTGVEQAYDLLPLGPPTYARPPEDQPNASASAPIPLPPAIQT